jgi:CelD/BcsL family acetyltransferase involved in cellulose biosynthesis
MKIKYISEAEYRNLWELPGSGLAWDCLFVLPFWLETVYRHLGAPGTPHHLVVQEGGQTVGAVPLVVEGDIARFLGQPSVCDYQDIVVCRGYSDKVVQGLLQHLADQGIRRLSLETLHPNAAVLMGLQAPATRRLFKSMELIEIDVTYETALPESWEDYLQQLNGKQRHEVRRKVRKLEAAGTHAFDLACNNGRLPEARDTFLKLFHLNRQDKAEFMDQTMTAYFHDLTDSLADYDLLRLYTLEVNDQATAAVLCFDYQGVRYLYNSGYDERYQDLSVGVLCKLFSIREGIQMGCRRYDFLKGAEIYKKRIGGHEVPLYRCELTL